MVAARSGNPDVVEQLLARGARVNARAARGQNALMWAVAQKHANVVKVLLAHGADIHARTEVWSQIMAVPPHGLPEYNRAIKHGGDTALMFAARVGDLNSAKILVEAGANVNDADAEGISAMVLAAHSGFADLVEFLLDKGADANSSAAGFTALHEAIMRRDDADRDRPARARRRSERAAARSGLPSVASSADFNFAPALVGATPFWLAARFNEPDVMRLLVKHGADPLFVHRERLLRHRSERPADAGDDRADGSAGNRRRPPLGSARPRPARSAGAGDGHACHRAWCRCQCRQHRRPHGTRRRAGAVYLESVFKFSSRIGAPGPERRQVN